MGDIAESLRRLVAAPHARYRLIAAQIRQVILAAGGVAVARKDVDSASALVALAVGYRHPVARHAPEDDRMDRGLAFVATALQ